MLRQEDDSELIVELRLGLVRNVVVVCCGSIHRPSTGLPLRFRHGRLSESPCSRKYGRTH
jgi:hypothetical protein